MSIKAVIIIGMHRSGTSALTQLLFRTKQYDLGKHVLKDSHDNPHGFFENERVVQFNDLLLSKYGYKWDTAFDFNHDSEKISNLVSKGVELIRSEYRLKKDLLIKDPRISLLLPYWKEVFRELNIELSFLMIIRNPTEIAASLYNREFFSNEKSYFLIGSYWLASIKELDGASCLFVDFDQLIRKDRKTISSIEKFIGSRNIDKINVLNSKARIHKLDKTIDSDFNYLNRIYSAIIESSIDPSGSVPLEIDSVIKEHRLMLKKYQSDLNSPNDFIKIIFDFGRGFSERDTLIYRREGKEFNKDIDLSFIGDKVNKIKILLGHGPVTIGIDQLKFINGNKELNYKLSHNSDEQIDNKLAFTEDHPQLICTLREPIAVERLSLALSFGFEHVFKVDNKVGAHSAPILMGIITIIKNPIKLFKAINRDNLRTLRLALKRESPKEIFKNVRKLLNRDKDQLIIENHKSKAWSQNTLAENHVYNTDVILKREDCEILKILYVTPSLPNSSESSGGKRATRLLSIMRKKNKVVLYSLKDRRESNTEYWTSEGFEVYHYDDQKGLKRDFPNFDFIIFSFYYTQEEAKKLLKLYPSLRTIIDTVDIHWVREKNSVGIWEGITEEKYLKNKKKELEAYKKVNQLWVVSEEDRAAVLKELPDKTISIIPNIHSLSTKPSLPSNSKNILFIGGYSHYPNIAAAKILAKKIFPIIRASVPNAKMFIAGSNAPIEIAELSQLKGVEFLGFVDENALRQLYRNCAMTIVPLLSGAGMKGKITEAISYGLPVITNNIGNQGIHLENEISGFITEDFHKMAQFAIGIIKNQYDINAITDKAFELLKEKVDPVKVEAQLDNSMYKPITINIVSWNKIELLKKCIESILTQTVYPRYSIQIYSNGCNDGTRAYLRKLSLQNDSIQVCLSDSNEVFVRPNNSLILLANDNSDIVLLNNDTEVNSNWLSGLYSNAYIHEDIGIVGSKVLYPDGRLQEFGAEIYKDGTGKNHGKGDENPYDVDYMRLKAVPYVSGCSMYIKRQVVVLLGVLDEQYHPCYFEDSDYCYRAWEHGFIVAVSATSMVIHHEGATSGTDEKIGMKRYQEMNKSKFLDKHKNQINTIKKLVKRANRKLEGF